MEFSAGTVVAERYAIEEPIGEGGMAVVYRVRHQQLDSLHALKVLTITSKRVKERLIQEGRLQAALRHPNIVSVTDVIEVQGAPGLVMELIDGPCLDDLIRAQKLTIDQADVIGRGLLAAVAHAHDHHLVHRDLKPANVMLQISTEGVVPKVTDFGLAKLVAGETGLSATRTGSTMGTPPYMSPEQIKDAKNVDARSDVFACGAILYELLTGERAFDADDLMAVFSRVSAADYRDPTEFRSGIPDRMLRAIRGALVADKDARIQSSRELFEIWTGGEAIPSLQWDSSALQDLARPDTLTEPMGASTLAAGGLVVGGGVLALGAAVSILLLLALVVVLALRPPDVVPVEVPVVVERPVPGTATPATDAGSDAAATELEADPPEEHGTPWGAEPALPAESAPKDFVSPSVSSKPSAPSLRTRDIPRRFKHGSVQKRVSALLAAKTEPESLPYLVHYARRAENPEIRQAAFRAVCEQLESGVAPSDAAVETVEWALGNRDDDGMRRAALVTYARAGRSLKPLFDQVPLERDVEHRELLVRAIGDVAMRMGTHGDARPWLERIKRDSKEKRRVVKAAKSQLERLPRGP